MADTLFFASGPQGECELSDGKQPIGAIEQVGTFFEIFPAPNSLLEGMPRKQFPSKQQALSAIEIHTGAMCRPVED